MAEPVKLEDTRKAIRVWKEKQNPRPWQTDLATEEAITALEAKAGRSIADPLKSMWTVFLTGEENSFSNDNLSITLYSPAGLLKALTPDTASFYKPNPLRGLGLINYLNYCWANDKAVLDMKEGTRVDNEDFTYTSHAQLLEVDTALTCFGHFMDGYCESHLVLHFDKDGTFGVTHWNQDENIPLEPTVTGYKTPEDILLKCLLGHDAVYAAGLEEDPDYCGFSLDELVGWLKTETGSHLDKP